MWWYFKKFYEDDKIIVYNYGFESRILTGTLEYDKIIDDIKVIKYAENHEKSYNFEQTLLHLIDKYHCPEEKMIAYG
ncbi:MAG: hypothetical protein LBG90_05890 [Spirochaetaceae bacterium]|jgi:hypothetical protein|nr:hypothetical protein [Spirochaetaceae bacterium]